MSQVTSSLDCPRSIENISTLWDQQNHSSQSVVLVLPDALRSKYYLKDFHGKLSEKEKREREMRRYEFLSNKMATAAMINRKTMEIMLTTSKKPSQNLVEKELDHKRLIPLRKDEKLMDTFLSRVEEIKQRKKENPKKKFVRPPIVLPQESRVVFLEREKAKSDAVQSRRSTPQQPQSGGRDGGAGGGFDDFFDIPPAPPISSPPPLSHKHLLARKWLSVIHNFQRMKVLFNILDNHRKHTSKYELEGRSVRLIQCRWRRVDMLPRMAVVVRRVMEEEGSRAQGRLVLKHRQDALAIITSFLSISKGGLQGLVKTFIRKVKRVQDLARCRFRLNFSRLTLLTILFDRTMKLLFSFVGLVVSGKLPKTLALEPSVLSRLKERNDPTVIRNLLSLTFFSKFNDYLSRNSNANKFWRATRQDLLTGKYECDQLLRERLLIDLLIRIRRRHVAKVMQARVKQSELPLIGEDEVREFIRGGRDPLQAHLLQQQYLSQGIGIGHSYGQRLGQGQGQRQAHDPIESLLKEFERVDEISSLLAKKRSANGFPPLLLLQTVTSEDLYDTARVYLEKFVQSKAKRDKDKDKEKSFPTPLLGTAATAAVAAGGGGRGRRRATLLKSYQQQGQGQQSSSSIGTVSVASGSILKENSGSGDAFSGSADELDAISIRPPALSLALSPAPPSLEKPSDSRKFRKHERF